MDNKLMPVKNYTWLSDEIGDDYKTWHRRGEGGPFHNASRIFIESPTGSGKTYFILNTLLRHAFNTNRKILYLGNRSALEAQIKVALGNILYTVDYPESKDIVKYKFFIYPGKSASITVVNYQSVLGLIKRNLISHFNNDYYYIVFDEAHYFLEDSLFNSLTFLSLQAIISQLHNSVFIFMSATINEFACAFNSIPLLYENFTLGSMQIGAMKYDNRIYKCGVVPNKYIPFYYTDNCELYDKIYENAFRDKWLIFVKSKENGNLIFSKVENIKELLINSLQYKMKNLQMQLQNPNDTDTVKIINHKIKECRNEIKRLEKCKIKFLTSQDKGNATWNSIVHNSQFNENVLITTKVIDNGINIKDSLVKHIVLPFSDKIEFIQMLGRKRMEENETANIYINYPSIKHFRAQKRQYEILKSTIEPILNLHYTFLSTYNNPFIDNDTKHLIFQNFNEEMSETLQKYWMQKRNIRSLFYIDKNKNLCVNTLASTKLYHLIELYEFICNDFDKTGYSRISNLISLWLGEQLCAKPKRLQEHLYGTLDEFIKNNLNKPIPEQYVNLFYDRYILIFNDWCDKMLSINPEKVKRWHEVKKAKDRKKAIICQSLEIAEKPYTITKRNNCWVLTDKDN